MMRQRSKWQLNLLMIACISRGIAGAHGSRQLSQDAGAGIAAVKEQHLQSQHAAEGSHAASTESAGELSLRNNFDDYALETLVRLLPDQVPWQLSDGVMHITVHQPADCATAPGRQVWH
jgi:hypothetical protein